MEWKDTMRFCYLLCFLFQYKSFEMHAYAAVFKTFMENVSEGVTIENGFQNNFTTI